MYRASHQPVNTDVGHSERLEVRRGVDSIFKKSNTSMLKGVELPQVYGERKEKKKVKA
jgi:hypothetical protein